MKRIWFAGAVGFVVGALFLCGAGAPGQDPGKKKGPFPGKGAFKGKGGGFERPLASEPRRGNPGASPALTEADFREIIAHAKDFDSDKDGKLSKAELPEMFATFFDRADTNRDGVLDQAEMKRVLDATASRSPTADPGKAPKGP